MMGGLLLAVAARLLRRDPERRIGECPVCRLSVRASDDTRPWAGKHAHAECVEFQRRRVG